MENRELSRNKGYYVSSFKAFWILIIVKANEWLLPLYIFLCLFLYSQFDTFQREKFGLKVNTDNY